jgi:hypothetical protein
MAGALSASRRGYLLWRSVTIFRAATNVFETRQGRNFASLYQRDIAPGGAADISGARGERASVKSCDVPGNG